MNELEIVFKAKQTEPDKRYRLLITLIRSDRPRFWNFLCIGCGSKVCELQGVNVIGVDDFYDPQNVNNFGIICHCKGFGKGMRRGCAYTYVFHIQ